MYRRTLGPTIIRLADGACIPPDPANRDYQEYLTWDAVPGNDPLPADTRSQQVATFEADEDDERLAIINERASTDPAYAALADFVLRGRQA